MIDKKNRKRSVIRLRNNKTINTEQCFDLLKSDSNKTKPAAKNYKHLFDKYTSMALEYLSCGDQIAAEFNYQYADHYLRILNANQNNNSENNTKYLNQKLRNESFEDSINEGEELSV